VLYGHTLGNATSPLRYNKMLGSSTPMDRTILTDSYFEGGRRLKRIQSKFRELDVILTVPIPAAHGAERA
jgi:hypothetical protein